MSKSLLSEGCPSRASRYTDLGIGQDGWHEDYFFAAPLVFIAVEGLREVGWHHDLARRRVQIQVNLKHVSPGDPHLLTPLGADAPPITATVLR